MNGIVDSKIHLEKQFELEGLQGELKGLKIDVAMYNSGSHETKSKLNLSILNTVFFYYLAYVFAGLAIGANMF